MSKRARFYDLALPAKQPGELAYVWFYRMLREGILAGRLRARAQLPSTRELAALYGVARGTVVAAFDILKAEGYVEGTIGSGTFVAGMLPDELFRTRVVKPTRQPNPKRRFSPYGTALRPAEGVISDKMGAFRAYTPALDLFPFNVWATLNSRRARRMSAKTLQGCPPDGLPQLREAISAYLNASRGVHCNPDQVVIVSGILEALDICTRLFLVPGDRVCIEDPGYPDAAQILESAGSTIVSIPVDQEGLQIDETRLKDARMIYVTPAHQAPLGVAMSLRRRLGLLDVAHRFGSMIFEDDYDSEYRYSGRPVPSLQGLDTRGNVIFAGSFSKALFPGLRLGYVVLPSDLVSTFSAARRQTVRHAQMLDQLTLLDFIDQGHFARHLRRMRQVYAERLNALVSETARYLGGLVSISPLQAGLQTIGWLTAGIDATAVVRAASARGVIVLSLHHCARRVPVPNGLLLGFAATPPREIRRGVIVLADALRDANQCNS